MMTITISAAANATAAKARAKFGRRLTPQHYAELLSCRSVAEAAKYLKERTDYAHALDEIKGPDIHRGRVEELLRRKVFEDCLLLCAFDHSGSDFFYETIVMRDEIRQILHCIRLLSFGREDEFLFRLPSFFITHAHIDLMALAKAQSIEDIAHVLKGTPYGRFVNHFHTQDPLYFTAIETALHNFLYETIFAFIRRHTMGSSRRELFSYFSMRVELYNVLRIIRLKSDRNLAPDALRSYLTPHNNVLRPGQIQAMLEAPTARHVFALLRKTKYGRRIENLPDKPVDILIRQAIVREAYHLMRFSVHPRTVFAAYIDILENELSNIITMIEGIRYENPPDEIRKLLVIEA